MKYKVTVTLTEEMLGTKPEDLDVFTEYLGDKHPSGQTPADERANAKEAAEDDAEEESQRVAPTLFHREDGKPGIYDYQIKGFFKDACGAINRMDKEYRDNLEKLTAYKTKIDGCVFVYPRFIAFNLNGKVGECVRPLRTPTPKGERVAIVRSESVPAGTTFAFEVEVLAKDLQPYVKLWLGYGVRRGVGQWRNSGKGRFTCTVEEVKG